MLLYTPKNTLSVFPVFLLLLLFPVIFMFYNMYGCDINLNIMLDLYKSKECLITKQKS